MSKPSGKVSLDPFSDILGLDLEQDRLDHDLRVYGDILQAIHKLRELDLTEVHPVVVFDPCVGTKGKIEP